MDERTIEALASGEPDPPEEKINCSMRSDGQCTQAGTEYCDTECPVMATLRELDRHLSAICDAPDIEQK